MLNAAEESDIVVRKNQRHLDENPGISAGQRRTATSLMRTYSGTGRAGGAAAGGLGPCRRLIRELLRQLGGPVPGAVPGAPRLRQRAGGLSVSCYAAGKIAAGPAGGLATDRLGPRTVTAASMAGSAVATVALAVVNGPGPVLATAALTGLVSQLHRPSTSAILAAEVPGPQRVKAFSVYQLGVSARTATGPAAGGLIAEHSFMILCILDAATSLAWAILAWRALPRSRASAAGTCPQPQAPHSLLGDRRLVRLPRWTYATRAG
jgi:MFS family permease